MTLGGDRSIQLSYGGLYRKYSILQSSRIRTIRFLGGGPSIPVRYGGNALRSSGSAFSNFSPSRRVCQSADTPSKETELQFSLYY